VVHTFKPGEAYQREFPPTRVVVLEDTPPSPVVLLGSGGGAITGTLEVPTRVPGFHWQEGGVPVPLTVYDLEGRRESRRLEGHEGLLVRAVMVEVEGVQAAIATCTNKDASIRVWSLEAMATIRELTGHEDGVNDLRAFHGADAMHRLLSGSKDGSFIIWLVATGEAVLRVQSPRLRHVYYPVVTRQPLIGYAYTATERKVVYMRREAYKVRIIAVDGRARVLIGVGGLPGFSETTAGFEMWELEDPVLVPQESDTGPRALRERLRAANKVG
jgi:hypothetical protein